MYVIFDDIQLPTEDPRTLVGTEYLDYDGTTCTVIGVATPDLYGIRRTSSPFTHLVPTDYLVQLLEQQPRLRQEIERRRDRKSVV